MRVCYFGTYRAKYSRNQIMIAGLRANGVEVLECHERLWHGIDDRVKVLRGGWLSPAFWVRVIKAYWRLMVKYKKIPDHDFLVVGYPGQVDVFLARWLARRRRIPLAWDVFMSLPLITAERGLDKANPLAMTLLHRIEKTALQFPDLLLQDTPQYVNWFQKNYATPRDRFRLVPTGADDRVFCRFQGHNKPKPPFRLLYYGTFIPNHGVEYIIQAIKALTTEKNFHLELIGDGPSRPIMEELSKKHNLKNIIFTDRLDKIKLVKKISQADICLGSFGNTPQAVMTIQNKVYETLAMAKPLITGESPAIAQTFTHGIHIYTCERENGESLAQAIQTLYENPSLRERLSQEGYAYYQKYFTIEKIGEKYIEHLREILPKE